MQVDGQFKGGRIAPPKCASNFQRDLEAQGTGGGEEIQLEADVRIQVEGSTRYTVVGYTLLAHHSKVKKPKRWNILSLTSLKRRIKEEEARIGLRERLFREI